MEKSSETGGSKPVLAAVRLSEVDLGQLHTLDAAERRLAARRSTPLQRDRFVAGRIALRFHVAKVAEANPGSLHADYLCNACEDEDRAHGSPRYQVGADGPLVRASLSRSGDWCLMAAAVDGHFKGVGLDLECFTSADFDGFEAVAMTAREREYIRKAAPFERPRLQTVLWTRKEAVLKALGTGLALDPSLVDVSGPLTLTSPPGMARVSGRWIVEDVNPGPLGLPKDSIAAMALLLAQ